MDRKKTIAIIPARKGSKSIPRKNLASFCGKPLVLWSIEQAVQSHEMSATYVTSDDPEILMLAEKHGALPILRPSEISGDTASTEAALEHALEQIPPPELLNIATVVLLQPTSPLRKPGDISGALAQFRSENWDSGFSAAILEDFLIWEKISGTELHPINYDLKNRGRRQDRKPQYVETGSIYLFKPEILRTHHNRLGGKIGMFMQDLWQAFELDNPQDWPLMEGLFRSQLEKACQ